MILEAFSEILKDQYGDTGESALSILNRWIRETLTNGRPKCNVHRVLHAEFALLVVDSETVIIPRSRDGEKLLHSLQHYCESYEHWMFRRWLHEAKTTDFKTA